MDRDTIIRLAREAELWEMLEGYSSEYASGDAERDCLPDLQRFAALVAAHEREACIDIVAMHGGSVEIEAAIRSRTA